MKIIYIGNGRLPTEKAYGVNMVKTCEALAKAGAKLTLIAPKNQNASGHDVFSFYGIEKVFTMNYVSIFDGVSRGLPLGYWMNQFTFTFSVLFSRLGSTNDTIILTRDEITGWLLRKRGFKVFYDMHGFPEHKKFFWRVFLRGMSGIVGTSEWKLDQAEKQFGIPRSKTAIAPNGFDPSLFQIRKSKVALREELGLPKDKKIVLYTGHLYDWKGVHVLARAARLSGARNDIVFTFVGGTWYHLKELREMYKDVANISFVGHKPYKEIPKYLKAADVLVLPNSRVAKEKRFAIYSEMDTAPIKLFEYMASGSPIVASDMPSIRAVVSEGEVHFVPPDEPEALLKGIEHVLVKPEESKAIASKALELSRLYTWDKRAEKILSYIKTSIAS
ncbi:MAG: glycosyltransferase family 4 protein [Parcubacteria group bacterium]|nr:glycosyltransferase family 4 protein [Parcubacteria group bacterium]